MSQNIKIIPAYQRTVLTPSIRRPESNLAAFDYGGDLEVVESVEELNDVAKLKESSTFDTDLPITTLNRWIVEKYGHSIPIITTAWGLQLPDTQLRVNGYSEPGGTYDVSFVRSDSWVEVFKNLSLNEIGGLDPFQLSEAFIDDNQLNDAAYPGPDPTPTRGFWTPVVYYGGLQRFNEANSLFELTYADFRLWFHYGKVLQECFCAAGWKMDCPFLLTDFGQRMLLEAIGEAAIYAGFASESPSFKQKLMLPATSDYAFLVGNTSPQVITGTQDPNWQDSEVIIFDDDSTAPFYDNGAAVDEGFFDTTVPAIQGFSGMWRYTVKLRITGGAAPITANFGFFPNATVGGGNIISSIFYDAAGIKIGVDLLSVTVPGGTITRDFYFYATVEGATAFRDVNFGLAFGDGVGLTIETGSTIEGHGEFVFIALQPQVGGDETINETILFPQSYLSPTTKAIELLESYCHRTNSKIYSDRARRIVGIYTEHDVPTYGQDTEPYYFETVEQDLSLMQVDKSAQVSKKDVVAPEKYVLGFKDSTDAYIDSIDKGQPFDAVIDMAPYADNIEVGKEQENRDNLTEPTLERDFIEIKTPNPNQTPISVMAVLDNMVGECSTKTAPRTAYAYGLVKQKIEGSIFYKIYMRRWGGVTTAENLFAYATQFPSGALVDSSNVDVDNDKTLVYDHTEAVTEPMKRYWIGTVATLYTAQTRRLQIVVGSFNRFLQLNFRSLFRFKFGGLDWKGRLKIKRTKVNDFHIAEIEVTEDKAC